MTLKVHSGNCCLCEVGIETGSKYRDGTPIHTGDIVILYTLLNDDDEWDLVRPLTVVVAEQFQSYSDGSVRLLDRPLDFYTMGIRTAGIANSEWRVDLAKKFSDVIPGERWPGFGFSYRENEAADAAILAKQKEEAA